VLLDRLSRIVSNAVSAFVEHFMSCFFGPVARMESGAVKNDRFGMSFQHKSSMLRKLQRLVIVIGFGNALIVLIRSSIELTPSADRTCPRNFYLVVKIEIFPVLF